MELLRPFSSLTTYLEVVNAEGFTLTCANVKHCRAIFRWDHTPRWKGQAPKVIYPGVTSALFINPQFAQVHKKEAGLAFDWKIDNVAVDFDGMLDFSTKIARMKTSYPWAVIMNEKRTLDADTTVHFNGAGLAYRMAGKGENCDIWETDCYTTRIHPTIKSMSASSGYTTGGQRLVLSGTSLDANESLEVLIDGEPCYITANNDK